MILSSSNLPKYQKSSNAPYFIILIIVIAYFNWKAETLFSQNPIPTQLHPSIDHANTNFYQNLKTSYPPPPIYDTHRRTAITCRAKHASYIRLDSS